MSRPATRRGATRVALAPSARSLCVPLALATMLCIRPAQADQEEDAGWTDAERPAGPPSAELPSVEPRPAEPRPAEPRPAEPHGAEPRPAEPHGAPSSAEAAPPPLDAVPPGPTRVEVPGPEPRVTLILDQPDGAQLMRENAIGWGTVCEAPCEAQIPRDDSFVVRTPGMPETGRLDLDESPERVRLHLDPPSTGALVAGSILTYAGLSILPLGLLTLTAGLLTDQPGVTAFGGVVTGVGGVGLGVGIPLMLSNRHSDVELEPIAQSRAWGLHASGNF